MYIHCDGCVNDVKRKVEKMEGRGFLFIAIQVFFLKKLIFYNVEFL